MYDAVAIGTMADEPKAAAFAMYLAREDLFQTVTMRAYPDDQVGAVVEYMAPLPTILPVRH